MTPGAATAYVVSIPDPMQSYETYSFSVTAVDAYGNTATSYNGSARLTSSDPSAALLVNPIQFANGTYSYNFGLKIAGTQTLTATDTAIPSITGTATTVVLPGPARRFGVSAPASTITGTPFKVTVTAYDLVNNVATSYSGTVHFTSTDAAAVLPADATLTNGTGTFSVTLKTPGSQTITATDTVASITGTSGSIAVSAPDLVVTTPVDDAGNAPNCTAQTTSGTGTDAACSLRDALLFAANAGAGNISFDATKFATAQTITLTNGILTLPANNIL